MLASSGCKVTDEEVYAELIGGSQENVTNLISTVLMAFSPAETNAKNSAAQTESQSEVRATENMDN
jgi:hypothetical protein